MYIAAANDSGEALHFNNCFFADPFDATYATSNAIQFADSATSSCLFSGCSFDDMSMRIGQANNVTTIGCHWENPGSANWGAYTYVVIDNNLATNFCSNGDTWFATGTTSPTNYISTGGNVTLNGAIVRKFTGSTMTNFAVLTSSGRITWTGLNNVSTTAITNVVSGVAYTPNGFANQAANSFTVNATAGVTTDTLTVTPKARTSGVAAYVTINDPADTGITTATESKGINIIGATRTWVDGTTTTQREYFVGKPTYNKTTTAATFTTAATLYVEGAPVAGSGVTITNGYSAWIDGTNTRIGAVAAGTPNSTVSGRGLEVTGTDNSAGGMNLIIANTNNGTSAFADLFIQNDLADATGTHYAVVNLNSSTYTSTAFGTALAVANQLAIYGTDGPTLIGTFKSGSYMNVVIGGSATANEVVRFTSAGMLLAENSSIALDPAGSADGKYTGTTVTATAGYSQAFGDLVYLDPTDSRWEQCDANSTQGTDGDSRGIIGMVVSAGTDGTACTILLNGIIRADAKFPTFTVNNPIYVSETAGAVTQTQPTTTDVVIRVVGFGITTDEMYFSPSSDYTTHT
jgi:hypothetical protein